MDGTLALGLNAGLLAAGSVAAFLISLGFVIFFSDTKSVTTKAFLALAITSVIWSWFNYGIYTTGNPSVMLWSLRLVMFMAVWFAFSFFTLFYAFPSRELRFPPWFRFVLIPVTATVSIITLTPFVFSGIARISESGKLVQVINGPGIFLFGIVAFALDFGAVILLIRKMMRAQGDLKRTYRLILIGTAITLFLIIVLNFMLPAFFGNSMFVAYGTLSLLPFIGCVAYAIDRGHVLNVKEIGTAFLVSALAVATFIELLFTTDPNLILFRTSLFLLILVVGILLIRAVIREVEQREEIQELADELSTTNKQQETLIHFIGHEVKGFLTKDEGALAALEDGDFGALPEETLPFVARALAETRHGVESVSSILKAANLKRGTVTFTKAPFDLKALAAEAVERARSAAESKGLTLSFEAGDGSFEMNGDKEQIESHVLRNLIDNAINYTPSGSISVALKREGENLVFSVKDAGVGVTDEDKVRLFTEGGHGKDSQTINAHSTGYGLYIAKQIAVAHGGTIRAESEGAGKGSTFVAEFPA